METKESFNWGRFLNFDEFIAGRFLKVLYVAGSLLIIIGVIGIGGVTTLTGLVYSLGEQTPTGMLGSLFWFLLMLIGGVVWLILWRVYCEIIMIFFKINENLQAIRDSNKSNS
ncbi:MAG TPA: DUF4282 domain-containing protein [Pyrinomonadaceae bacterium]|jgi:hypothetical protein|nr:DUF4282 domain-containing protein [Pyrinomonadaceae bacterium]